MSRLDLKNVSVEIPLRGLRGQRGNDPRIVKGARGGLMVRALQDISFSVGPGERLGLLGSNGAGKTTLLRLLAGILPPSSGNISTEGKVHAVFSLGDGIKTALTGRENAHLRYHLLDQPTGSVEAFIDDVQSFSELSDFFDLPVNTYSPGMASRLLFALSTIKHADIMLLDEWIGVSDMSFQAKAATRLQDLINRNDILIVASHNPQILRNSTGRILVLEQGRISREISPDQLASFAI